jgi:hypothetical protein
VDLARGRAFVIFAQKTTSPERRLIKAPKLSRVRGAVQIAQIIQRRDANFQMLVDRALVKRVGGSGQFDFAM